MGHTLRGSRLSREKQSASFCSSAKEGAQRLLQSKGAKPLLPPGSKQHCVRVSVCVCVRTRTCMCSCAQVKWPQNPCTGLF